ncbi:hypothetical protein DSO57_1036725 [Entomophthora muscae]|uniref:Uncharacterized protein n=1 Tax=Entomophthora muscae TaxID=34485 RepID=A0ACC2SBW6_9FUNG|nr:hypothetical protein DSO57_1036725 [Entomophthora muscae]
MTFPSNLDFNQCKTVQVNNTLNRNCFKVTGESFKLYPSETIGVCVVSKGSRCRVNLEKYTYLPEPMLPLLSGIYWHDIYKSYPSDLSSYTNRGPYYKSGSIDVQENHTMLIYIKLISWSVKGNLSSYQEVGGQIEIDRIKSVEITYPILTPQGHLHSFYGLENFTEP